MNYLNNLNYENEIKEVIVRGSDAKIKIKFKDEAGQLLDLKKYIVTYDVLDEDGRHVFKDLSFSEKFINDDKFFNIPYAITEKLNGKYNLKIYIASLEEKKAFNNLMEVR
ncbi:MAG: Unknown protein [uncultured Sulfurovum sp.]|uniref:Uncharacterized protein n=1 Tax=uncultured Sulfurovum sp. TaxID=269237 RepID=A0A6S6SW13_9BACT|nr:MAG: Unknown protein [uncultured Sulfurovum sp.]